MEDESLNRTRESFWHIKLHVGWVSSLFYFLNSLLDSVNLLKFQFVTETALSFTSLSQQTTFQYNILKKMSCFDLFLEGALKMSKNYILFSKRHT